jgi:hypothetical protein
VPTISWEPVLLAPALEGPDPALPVPEPLDPFEPAVPLPAVLLEPLAPGVASTSLPEQAETPELKATQNTGPAILRNSCGIVIGS